MKLSFTLTGLVFSFLIVLLFSIGSCSKEKSSGTDQEQQEVSFTSAEAESKVETVFNGVFDDMMGVNDDVGMSGTGIFGRGVSMDGISRPDSLPACATVKIEHSGSSTFFPVRITIDFGTNGCTRPTDGHTRKGKIIIEYTNRLIVPGAIAAATFDNFYIDDTKIEGTLTITNTSTPNSTPPSRQFKVEVKDARLSLENGNYIEWSSMKTIIQTDGLVTPLIPADDIFKIEGSSKGKTQKGNLLVAWQSAITSPLIKEFECRWIVQGTVKITLAATNTNNTWAGYLDYGDGNCDNQATATINGVKHQISLH
ncbi:MAG: hypothetical protein JSS80_08585 [Bacteroidetes bacterium]|nr:hypothetical protein [Bacteroidota bacterium]